MDEGQFVGWLRIYVLEPFLPPDGRSDAAGEILAEAYGLVCRKGGRKLKKVGFLTKLFIAN